MPAEGWDSLPAQEFLIDLDNALIFSILKLKIHRK